MANFTHGTNGVTVAKSAPLWVRLWPLWICVLVLGFMAFHCVPDAARNIFNLVTRS